MTKKEKELVSELVWISLTTAYYDGTSHAASSTKKENQNFLTIQKKNNDIFFKRYLRLIKELKLNYESK